MEGVDLIALEKRVSQLERQLRERNDAATNSRLWSLIPNLSPSLSITTVPATAVTSTQMHVRRLAVHSQPLTKTEPDTSTDPDDIINPIVVSVSTLATKKPRLQSVITISDDEDTRPIPSNNEKNRFRSSTTCVHPDVEASGSSLMPLEISKECPNVSNDNNHNPRTKNTSSCNKESENSYLKLKTENKYDKYITNSRLELQFDVKKILLKYDDYLTKNSMDTMIANKEMSIHEMKDITSTVCVFLMKVYGATPSKTVKDAMAESLFRAFPFVKKDVWYNAVPGKSPTGRIQHRISNTRQKLRDRRKQVRHQQGKSILPH